MGEINLSTILYRLWANTRRSLEEKEEQWLIGTDVESESRESMLATRLDDDDNDDVCLRVFKVQVSAKVRLLTS